MLRLDPSCSVFTSTHLLLVRLCLHAKSYGCALPVLDKHICHFPGSAERAPLKSSPLLCASQETGATFITSRSGLSTHLTWRDQSRYFLYGGMIYMALKEWKKASHFLELVMSMPTVGPISMIMVEAYKKWVLVGLIEAGKVSPIFYLLIYYQTFLLCPNTSLASLASQDDSSKCAQHISIHR